MNSPVSSELPPVLLNSLPKSGTHLLLRVFEGLPKYTDSGKPITTHTAEGREDPGSGLLVGVSTPRAMKRPDFVRITESVKPAMYLAGHLPFSEATRTVLERKQFKMVALLRDPRAVVCSFAHFISSRADHSLHKYFTVLPTMEARIGLAIKGMKPGPDNDSASLLPIAQSFESVAQWMTWPGAVLVFFEDLVGPKGGGSSTAQLRTLDMMLKHLGYDLGHAEKVTLSQSLFSAENIFFRKGQINDWKNYFTPKLENCFEKHAGDALARYRELRRSLDTVC